MSTCCRVVCVVTFLTVFSITSTRSSEVTSHFAPECKDGKRFRERCYKLGARTGGKGYHSDCDLAVISDDDENDFVTDLINAAGEVRVWIGRDLASSYHRFRFGDQSDDCYYMDNGGTWHPASWCEYKRRVVCEWDLDCQDGWYGDRCEVKCHCHREICTRELTVCKYGCEQGWTGDNCTEEITTPIVEHYCFKYNTRYTLALTMKENSQDTGSLVPLDVEGYPIKQEQYTEAFNGSNVVEISTTDLSLPFQPNYHERKVDSQGTTFEWSFRLRHFKSARTLGDLDFRVMCNFSKADVMDISTSIEFESASVRHPSSSFPLPMQMDVDIMMTDPSDTKGLTDVSIGQSIKVLVNQQSIHPEDGTVEEDTGQLVFLSPRSCEARSADNRVVKQLSDGRGCGVEPGLTGWFNVVHPKGAREAVTKPFPAFGLPGSANMNISCSLVPCSYDDWSCKQPCIYAGGN